MGPRVMQTTTTTTKTTTTTTTTRQITRANLPVVDVGAVLLNVPRKNHGLENVALPKVREENPVVLMGLVNEKYKKKKKRKWI